MCGRIIPETKGKSLEEMDIIFGAVSEDQRARDVEKYEREIAHAQQDTTSQQSIEQKA